MTILSILRVHYDSEKVSFLKIVTLLLDSGWTLNDYGSISYLPLGTSDSSAWQKANLHEKPFVMEIVQNKEIYNELIGLVIVYKESKIGCTLLLSQKGTLTVTLNVNRKCINSINRLTDVSWYVEHLLLPLITHEIPINKIVWEEFND